MCLIKVAFVGKKEFWSSYVFVNCFPDLHATSCSNCSQCLYHTTFALLPQMTYKLSNKHCVRKPVSELLCISDPTGVTSN